MRDKKTKSEGEYLAAFACKEAPAWGIILFLFLTSVVCVWVFFSSQRTQNTRRLVLVCHVMSLDNWLGVFNVVSGSIDWREDTRMYNSWMRNRLEKQQQMHMRINGKRGSRFTVIRWLESKVLVCMNTIRSQRDFLLVLEEKKIML